MPHLWQVKRIKNQRYPGVEGSNPSGTIQGKMAQIILVACASKKAGSKSKAKNLYISNLFALNMQYAESLHPDKIFILSAKHLKNN